MKKEERQYLIEQAETKDSIGEVSDGYHSFNSLYRQRLYLFAALVNTYKDKAWKTRKHCEDGKECFGGGWFLVGIDTPEGSYTYHYENEYWDLFECKEIPESKPFDGHTDEDVTRVLTLPHTKPSVETIKKVISLYKRWYSHQLDGSVEGYVKDNWEGK